MPVIAKLVFGALLVTAGGCAAPSHAVDVAAAVPPSRETQLDLYEAAVRSRLAQMPLAPHRDLHLFMNDGVVPGLSSHFKEYHVFVHSGCTGPSTPRARWYWLHLGHVTADTAFVCLQDARSPTAMLSLELRKRGDHWVVVNQQPFVVTLEPSSNPATQSAAAPWLLIMSERGIFEV